MLSILALVFAIAVRKSMLGLDNVPKDKWAVSDSILSKVKLQ